MEREVAVARQAALQAGRLAMSLAGGSARTKADDSPVTDADVRCEQLIISTISAAFPSDCYLGEESGREGTGSRRWIIDPVDGTRDFMRGVPTWANLIALEVDGTVVLGVCNLAAQERCYWAAQGLGVWCNDERILPRADFDRRRAVLAIGALTTLGARQQKLSEEFGSFWAVRSMGGCQDAMLVLSGRAEAWVNLEASPWDLAPFAIMAAELDYPFFNFDGGSSIFGGDAVICVPELESELRGKLCHAHESRG
jgi:fructose-1,6-bisphosphatase/inositol monophosphatase family enzyme